MSYKTFVDPDILSGSELQEYFMHQVIMGFASRAIRAATLTGVTLVPGMTTFLADERVNEQWDGSNWIPVFSAGVPLRLTADYVPTVSGAIGASNLIGSSGQLWPNAVYRLSGVLFLAGSAGGFKLHAVGTGVTGKWGAAGGTTADVNYASAFDGVSATAVVQLNNASGTQMLRLDGLIKTDGTGSGYLSWYGYDGGSLAVLATDSIIEMRRIG